MSNKKMLLDLIHYTMDIFVIVNSINQNLILFKRGTPRKLVFPEKLNFENLALGLFQINLISDVELDIFGEKPHHRLSLPRRRCCQASSLKPKTQKIYRKHKKRGEIYRKHTKINLGMLIKCQMVTRR